MLEFKFESKRVIVDAKTMMIAGISTIWEDDDTKTKETASKLLTYVHLVSQLDAKAPYFQSSFDEVRMLVKKDLFGDMDFAFPEDLDLLLENTIEEYQKAYEPPEYRMRRMFIKKIDQTRNIIEDTDPEIVKSVSRGQTTFSSNFSILQKMMGELDSMFEDKEKLEARIKKQASAEMMIRGEKKISLLEQRLNKSKMMAKSDEDNGSAVAPEDEPIEENF